MPIRARLRNSRRAKISAVLIAGVTMIIGFTPTNAGADPWTPTVAANSSQIGVDVVNSNLSTYVSYLSSNSPVPGSNFDSETQCSGYELSGPCSFTSPDFASGQLLLPVCTNSTQTNCIASMSLGTSSTSMVPSTFVSMTQGPTVDEDEAEDLPEGSTVGLWTNPLTNAGGTNTYATAVSVAVESMNGKIVVQDLEAQILPYAEESGSYQIPTLTPETVNGVKVIGFAGVDPSCAWTANNICGKTQDFQPGTEASLSIRVSNEVGGWFQGRFQDPNITVVPFGTSSNTISVTALSVATPELDVVASMTSPDPGVQSFLSLQPRAPDGQLGGISVVYGPDDSGSMNAVNDFREVANDTASGVVNIWSFASYSDEGNSCLSNTSKVLGVVSTNAMAFQGTAPTFADGELQYQVAGMHYLPDGSIALGNYDLVISDAVARCLYHFTNAPISASIQVTDTAGVQNVATTSVTDNGGWLHLAAYGFTFSDHTISVRLHQTTPKKTSITCVSITHPKVTKTLSGSKTKCPSGYRREESK